MSLLQRSTGVWRSVYEQYDVVMKAKADLQKDAKKRKLLLNLDKWYQEELPAVIGNRTEKFITHEELCKLMKWKLMRGKFRPRLEQMVADNCPDEVEAASKKAFKALPNLRAAIDALVVLKAVGPATASAVLAAGAPQNAPFMADESMLSLPGLQPLKYTLPAYLSFAQQVAELAKKLQKQESGDFKWSCHCVELALWTCHMAKTLKLDSVLNLLQSATDNCSKSEPSSAHAKVQNKRSTKSDAEKPFKKKKT